MGEKTRIVGIPKEVKPEERRVAATPKTVRRLKKLGFDVLVAESGMVLTTRPGAMGSYSSTVPYVISYIAQIFDVLSFPCVVGGSCLLSAEHVIFRLAWHVSVLSNGGCLQFYALRTVRVRACSYCDSF